MAPDTMSLDDSIRSENRGEVCWLVRAMDSARPQLRPMLIELPAGGDLRIGRGPDGISRQGSTVRIETDDHRISVDHARIVRRSGSWTLEDNGSKNGCYVDGQRVTSTALSDGNCLELGGTIFMFRRSAGPVDLELARASVDAELAAMRTCMPELAADLATMRRVAGSAIPVLLTGETGTGKELAARAIHQLSGRAGELVGVNCGALPATLLESQLFGYVKGAFSGAERDADGLVRAADRGTLFLDEIAELSPESQVALLRVLQESEVLPVGATRPVPVDLRVVAATHRDLEAAIAGGRFREDLYARIAGATVRLRPLRERLEDIGLLAGALLADLGGERAAAIRLHRKTARALFCYDWPRNVRELRSALELALTASPDEVIGPEALPDAVTSTADPQSVEDEPAGDLADRIREALRLESGNVSAAARRVGYSRAHVNRVLKREGIDPGDYR